MMLMKLLHTTNTLSEAKDQPHRYKVRAGGVPNFGGASESVVKDASGNAARVKTGSAQPVAKASASASWARKLNPFVEQGAPVERTAVQGELSLDNVKPLRNDLNDLAGTELAKPVQTVQAVEATPGPVRHLKIGSMEIPVVKVTPVWQRVRGWVQRLRP